MRGWSAIFAAALFAASPAAASQEVRPSLQDSFALGTSENVLCRVQSRSLDPALRGMFDRAYEIICRDAATPVGRVYALRNEGDDPAARAMRLRQERVKCGSPPQPTNIEDLGKAEQIQCRLADVDVGYLVYSLRRGRTTFVAEGLGGYDSALRLALRTIVADRIVPGELTIASSGAGTGDASAFARVQAGSLNIEQALEEGYRRNNSGNYAEAAEFFDTLLQRAEGDAGRRQEMGEYRINRALQKSNLGAYAEAEALFDQALAVPESDPVQLRLRRNFYALHLLNQRDLEQAAALLDQPIRETAAAARASSNRAVISVEAADAINSRDPIAWQLRRETAALTPEERVAILDAQAMLLRGSIHRLQRRPDEASSLVQAALAALLSVRGGRVTSIARLRAQGLNELALLAEARQAYAEAEKNLRDAVDVLVIEYPGSTAVAAATSRLAHFYARRGSVDKAIELYRSIVARSGDELLAGVVGGDMLAPYFALLVAEMKRRPELASDFFAAGETLVRPGVANTQAVLARELSAGDDDAARLFRQAVNLSRQVEQTRVAIARLTSLGNTDEAAREQARALTQELEQLQNNQVATQARLGEFSRYRALSTEPMTLQELQATLRPTEAYLKMLKAGDTVYSMLVTPRRASVHRSSLSAVELEETVSAIRNTIALVQDGELVTYPFDLDASRKLYGDLFGPLASDIASVQHIIFEPAGAMLQLPPNLLVTDDSSIAAYRARVQAPDADPFDFSGIAWLGRKHEISTAVSPRAFRDIRAAPPSNGKKQYLGAGQNAPVDAQLVLAGGGTRGGGAAGNGCAWPITMWNQPISDKELVTAQGIIGAQQSQLLTGEAFTDTVFKRRQDLSDYRILHFATHGLVTPPRPECAAEPALLTSFPEGPAGDVESDGLLSFREIFDLRLDADLIILSACDTAGAATAAATRAAGLSGGGDFALDGLVRAFIGAGGRSVIASHWPAPDAYSATERLISGLFTAGPGTSTVGALREAQLALMDRPETSHPYYWAGFAIIGDGSRPVLSAR